MHTCAHAGAAIAYISMAVIYKRKRFVRLAEDAKKLTRKLTFFGLKRGTRANRLKRTS
jgi:hypothetical protein